MEKETEVVTTCNARIKMGMQFNLVLKLFLLYLCWCPSAQRDWNWRPSSSGISCSLGLNYFYYCCCCCWNSYDHWSGVVWIGNYVKTAKMIKFTTSSNHLAAMTIIMYSVNLLNSLWVGSYSFGDSSERLNCNWGKKKKK